MPLFLVHVPTRAARLQISIPLLRQRRHRTSRALEANTSTSPDPQHASRAPDLHTSLPPHLHAYSALPDLYTSTSPPPDLFCGSVPRPTACLPSSRSPTSLPPRLHACSPTPYVLLTTR